MSTVRIELYKSKFSIGGRWRWRTRCPQNGKVLARSTEGYHNKTDCKQQIFAHFGALATINEVSA